MRPPSALSPEPAAPTVTATPTAPPVTAPLAAAPSATAPPVAAPPVAAPAVVVALAAALLGAAPVAAPAAAAPAARVAALAPECGDASDADFPIGTTLHAGPGTYRAGDHWRPWRLDLRNTTRVACAAIHPVALFADQGRALRPGHLRVEFHDPYERRWRPVRFEVTDQDENVGVFDGGSRRVAAGGSSREVPRFKGFTVPARKTLTVRVRVRFAADAPTGPASAAVTAMQRQHQDGDWVGQSGTYRFTIEAPGAAARTGKYGDVDGTTGGTDGTDGEAHARQPNDTERPDTGPGTGAGTATHGAETGTGPGTGNGSGGHRATGPGTGTGAGSGAGEASPGGGPAGGGAGVEPGEPPADAPPQLAATGSGPPWWGLLALALGLVGAGVPLVARARRVRR
ncbi:hypothetical protein OYE22_22290 [Streptomyces sp. 71268]|uniref:hypothetical protein n=1 Tax=Streptomyces sp. 71268 TaxID=3002640 RepID=UPI0023F6C393|nr:hypothetical protein [Streptomyces sp. 71268]WEV27608.1 hypothetical protein OYE22_22290 [Streptomyces sp. 71268]